MNSAILKVWKGPKKSSRTPQHEAMKEVARLNSSISSISRYPSTSCRDNIDWTASLGTIHSQDKSIEAKNSKTINKKVVGFQSLRMISIQRVERYLNCAFVGTLETKSSWIVFMQWAGRCGRKDECLVRFWVVRIKQQNQVFLIKAGRVARRTGEKLAIRQPLGDGSPFLRLLSSLLKSSLNLFEFILFLIKSKVYQIGSTKCQ